MSAVYWTWIILYIVGVLCCFFSKTFRVHHVHPPTQNNVYFCSHDFIRSVFATTKWRSIRLRGRSAQTLNSRGEHDTAQQGAFRASGATTAIALAAPLSAFGLVWYLNKQHCTRCKQVHQQHCRFSCNEMISFVVFCISSETHSSGRPTTIGGHVLKHNTNTSVRCESQH